MSAVLLDPKRTALHDISNKGASLLGVDKARRRRRPRVCPPPLHLPHPPQRASAAPARGLGLAQLHARAVWWQGSTALLGTSAALPPNVRVTRQAAARARQAALQEQQLEQQMQAPGTDSMDVDTTDAHMVEAPLDPTHRSDPQECNHYVNEIYAYLQELEVQYQVSPHFMQVSARPRRTSPPPFPFTTPVRRARCS